MLEFADVLTAYGPIGVTVSNITLEDTQDEAVRSRLRAVWIDKGLIVFRGVEGPEMQIALSSIFGPCVAHPGKPMDGSKSHPELVNVRYARLGGDVYEVDGVELGAWLPWHSDLVYVDKINHGGIIRPIQLPSRGGETGFIDKIKLYETLAPELRRQIEDKSVYYQWDLDISNQRFGKRFGAKVVQWSDNRREMQSRIDQYPRVVHPAVFSQPETGRKVLNISPWFALGIEGMEPAAGDALLEAVVQHCIDEHYAYFHNYRMDEMVLWDNWRMLHCATGIPADEERWIARTTIAGDYSLGRLDNEGAVIDDRIRVNV